MWTASAAPGSGGAALEAGRAGARGCWAALVGVVFTLGVIRLSALAAAFGRLSIATPAGLSRFPPAPVARVESRFMIVSKP